MQQISDLASFFRFLSGLFHDTGTPALLIGGYAVNQYNVSRQTADVDFMIATAAFDLVYPHLEKAGYTIELKQEAFIQLFTQGPGLGIDFMLSDPDTLETMISRGKQVLIADQAFTIPCLDDLLALKLHSIRHNPMRSGRDIPDIVFLLTENGISPDSERFKALCDRYGTDEILKRILGDFHG